MHGAPVSADHGGTPVGHISGLHGDRRAGAARAEAGAETRHLARVHVQELHIGGQMCIFLTFSRERTTVMQIRIYAIAIT